MGDSLRAEASVKYEQEITFLRVWDTFRRCSCRYIGMMLTGELSNGERTTKGDQGHCGVLYYIGRLQTAVFQGLGDVVTCLHRVWKVE